jgi:hypothetical protein
MKNYYCDVDYHCKRFSVYWDLTTKRVMLSENGGITKFGDGIAPKKEDVLICAYWMLKSLR